jgi:serine phosphatase RsbU (regulator of sigma subunit)
MARPRRGYEGGGGVRPDAEQADRSSDQREALARRPENPLRPVTLVSGICVLGLLLTALASWAAWRTDRSTEERLLQTQTSQAATVVSKAVLSIQEPLEVALDVQRAVGPGAAAAAFTERFASIVGPDRLFVSASLWLLEGSRLVQLDGALVGTAPGMDAEGPAIQTFLRRALSSGTSVVQSIAAGRRTHIAYALADAPSGFVVYAEPTPADRRTPVDQHATYSDLDYAVYLGGGTRTADLSTTNLDPSDLPLTRPTYRIAVPFGDTVLTLVTSPRHHLGGAVSPRLPWMLLVVGLLLTAATAVAALRLIRSRRTALRDNATITELFQRVDTLFDAQRGLFVRLQRALLPQVLPELPGFEVAAEYVAGAEGIDIGGDWYSVIALGEEEFAFVIGDVSGRGVDAVAEMARARFTLRAYLFDGDAPHEALEKCARQFDITTDGHLVTVLVAVGNTRTGRVTLANAGHPSPLLVTGGSADFVEMPIGVPLGAGGTTYDSITLTMPAGATLLVYTDGLVERRGEDIDEGLRRLSGTAVRIGLRPLEVVLAEILTAAGAAHSSDDIAVLALRRGSP